MISTLVKQAVTMLQESEVLLKTLQVHQIFLFAKIVEHMLNGLEIHLVMKRKYLIRNRYFMGWTNLDELCTVKYLLRISDFITQGWTNLDELCTGPTVLNLFESIDVLSSSSTQDLLPQNQLTDPSDFAQIEITIKFSGYVDANLDISIMQQDKCRQEWIYYGKCFPYFSCLKYTKRTYEKNSTKTIKYTFVKQRLVGELPYTRGQTTIEQTTTQILSTSTTKTTTTIPSTTAKETTTTTQVQTTVEDISTPVTTSLTTEIMTEIETTTKSDTTTSNVQIKSEQPTTTEGLTTFTTTKTLQSTNPDKVTSSEQTAKSTSEHTTSKVPETTSSTTS
ncbi:unnamed protein product [Mytilus edulis]|uniref:Uncharacterized protein n=1 Tax=Mytilus edulis TaxID=6550 RepID=A0A8S3TPP9_MYTED|nr:unnamed protein product [Mytilus edulis]